MTDLDWDALIDEAERPWDKDEIKRGLPLEWVLAHLEIPMVPAEDGRLIGLCPFHSDSTPSFACWEHNGEQYAGCWSCDFRTGDVFDFLGRWHQETDFQAVGAIAAELYAAYLQDNDWKPQPRTGVVHQRANPTDLIAIAAAARDTLSRQGAPTTVDILCLEKNWHFDGAWLAEAWDVGASDRDTIVIPHWRSDDAGGLTLTGLKTRTARSTVVAKAGSDLSALYGEWRDQMRPMVVICEGESDTWTADYVLQRAGREADVLGLPSGISAAIRADWLDRLRGRSIILAFDGDAPGRAGARRWHQALAQVADVRIAALPDGQDLSSALDPLAILEGASHPSSNTGVVASEHGNFTRFAGDTPVLVANWDFTAARAIRMDDDRLVFEGRTANHKDLLLGADDLASERAIRSWASRIDGSWRGTTKDAQDVLTLLQAEAPFLSQGRGTTVAGWHDGAFVWPGGSIAPPHQHWTYLPPKNSIGLEHHLRGFKPGDPDEQETLLAMLGLRAPEVMSPILAWLFLAPVRSLFDRFPPLTVTGSAGCGKTATLDTVLSVFGWGVTANLTATTPHAVHSFAGATNGIPVWYDEYRNAIREDAKVTLEQVLRDAWAGQSSFKGGMQADNFAALTELPARAPLIVSGEDAFTETSHAERLIQVFLSSHDRDPAALRRVKNANYAGFGYSYVSWLVHTHMRGELPLTIPDSTVGRVEYNLACMEVGWQLLEDYANLALQIEVPSPDWSAVRANVTQAALLDPYSEVVRWGAITERAGVQFDDAEHYLVQVATLHAAAKRGGFKLPGGVRAMERHLVDTLGGTAERRPGAGDVVRIAIEAVGGAR